jgi:small nuclear ribonucleoprotein (snRNP)-like protein
MKQPPAQGNSKPNAWSKPLQGSHTNRKNANPSFAASSAGAAQAKSSHVASNNSSKAPPGLSKPHHAEKNTGSSNANLNALRERYLHLLLTLVGHKVTVVLKSNVKYTGILHTATPFSHLPESHRHKYVLKAVTADGEDDNDDTATKIKPGQTVLLDMDSVVQLHVKSCRLDALVGSSKGSMSDAFTDTEISGAIAAAHGNRPSRGSNDLIQADATWTSAADPTTPTLNSRALKLAGGSLASSSTSTPAASTSGALKGTIAGWDQFKANEELFNVVGSYDESVYTTTLDCSQFSASDRQRAEQLAREIESTTSSNLHIAEERGHVLSQDYDEEDRYSGVLKPNMKPKLNYAQVVTSKTTDPVPPGFDGESDIATAETKPEADPAAATAAIETESATPAVTEPVESVEDKKPEELEPTIEKPKEEAVVAKEDAAAVVEANSAETVEVAVKAEGDAAAAAAEKPTPPEPKFKLSATAKSFSFNINAKSFTPTPPPPPPPPVPPPQFMDHSAGIPMMMTMGAPMIPEGKRISCSHLRFIE